MNVLSLFDGISAGKIALERAGIKVDKYFASEIDKYAIKISQKNNPDIIQLGDVSNWKNWELPKIDLIIGGSPCQGFSNAGRQLNFEDPRSRLFFTFVEILDTYKPKYFLLENVKMKKEWQDIITDYLKVEPILINSSLVSAQNRERLYWANFNISQPEDKNIFLTDIILDDIISLNLKHTDKALDYMNRKVSDGRNHWDFKHHSDIKNKKSSAVVANFLKGIPYNVFIDKDCVRKFHPIECERLQTFPDNYTEGISDTQRYKSLGNSWTVDVVSNIFKNMKGEYDKV